MTPTGIEPTTFQLVAQRLNQLRHRDSIHILCICTLTYCIYYVQKTLFMRLAVEQTVVTILTIPHCVFIYTGYKYILVFSVITLCRLRSGYQHSGRAYCLYQNRSLRVEAADSYVASVNTYQTTE